MLISDIDIYPVTGQTSLRFLGAVLQGGAKIVQLRNKNLSKRELFDLAQRYRQVTQKYKALLIINDHLDIALGVSADGVHLGQADLPLKIARRIAPDLIIGVSTHNLEEALAAEKDGATYINIGPIFKTETKKIKPVGTEIIGQISRRIKTPFTVMGGINLSNLDQVLEAGAKRVAVVSALTRANDPEEETRRFIKKIKGWEK